MQGLFPPEHSAEQEASQPPLYYLLGSLAARMVHLSDDPPSNPHAVIGFPVRPVSNVNRFIHSSEENFPYHDLSLAVHIVRWMSLFFGALTVLATYFLALSIFPVRRDIALAAAAINAFIPQFLFISTSVSNDGLNIFLCTVCLLFIVRFLKNPDGWGELAVIGIVAGLAALAKLSGLFLAPLALTVVGFTALTKRSVRIMLVGSTMIIAPVVIIASWWYIRNYLLYHDITGLNQMLAIVGQRGQISLLDLLSDQMEMQGLRWSFWGIFGWFNILADSWFYQFFDIVTALTGIGVLVFLVRGSMDSTARSQVLILTIWIMVVFIALLRWSQITLGSQGRLLFPAISAFAVLLSLGWASLWPRRMQSLGLVALPGLMFILALFALVRYLAPAYASAPAFTSPLDIVPPMQTVGANFGGKIELVGYRLLTPSVGPNDVLELKLYWKALSEIDYDYTVFVHLAEREHQPPFSQSDSFPGRGNNPTSAFRLNQIIEDDVFVRVKLPQSKPTRGYIIVGLNRRDVPERLSLLDQNGQKVGNALTLSSVGIVAP
ncbi:MAG: hypothetical protein JW384_03024 [Nitrosomonadaceae bacterium]|nr:hypothetical protein [Nitrosomonadaceae bacterium]